MSKSKEIEKSATVVKFSEDERFNEKHRLLNNLCDHLQKENCKFPNTMGNEEMKKEIMILTFGFLVFWYLDGNTSKFADKAVHGLVPVIPERFIGEEFVGYNDWRRKKRKAPSLSSETLKAHSTLLFRFLSGKYTKSWGGDLRGDLELLSMCMSAYASYLDKQNEAQQKRQKTDSPPKQIGEHTWLEIFDKTERVDPKYSIIDNCIRQLDMYEYICFQEEMHCKDTFDNYMQKTRFIENIRLSVPVCVMTYCPAKNIGTIVYLWQVPSITATQNVDRAVKIYDVLKDTLPVYHTRQMRKDFVSRFCRLNSTKIPKSVLRSIYTEFTGDASVNQNPVIEARIQEAILSEDPDLVIDLRHLNTGAPSDTFNTFYDRLNQKVKEFAAVDERRHGEVCHFSKFMSVRELIEDTQNDLPAGTPIPSKSSFLFSFVPKNSHSKVAKLYTSKVGLQFKVQSRQLRLSSIDQHYCAAQFKYAREYAIKYRDTTSFLCVDDKCKVDYGEPGQAMQTGVRGKKAIIQTGATLAALDHDQQSKGSLTPSVILKVDVPEDMNGSFYHGEVNVTYKDSVFEASSPFRHATETEQFLAKSGVRPVLIIYSDGGPDHRVNFHSVKLSLIVLFKRLGIDTLIAVRTAPGNSWLNPAERQMSILNLALQNCALMRDQCSSDAEQALSSYNSMADIRKKATKIPGLEREWSQSVHPVKAFLEERTKRLVLKGVPFQVQDAAEKEEVDERDRNVQMYIDATIEHGKYQQQHLKSKKGYQKFLKDHTKERHYMFQVRKCEDLECCGPRMDETVFPWLPDPVLDKEHYKPFNEVLFTDTEDGRPSANIPKPRQIAEQLQGVRNDGLVGQNVRRVVACFDCSKPRCIYSRKTLTYRDGRALTRLLEKYDYSCGSLITPEGDALDGVITVRLQMTCQTPVEFPYYASTLGQQDLCAHCADRGAERDQNLLKQYKIVLPVCKDCSKTKDIPKRNPIKN